MAIVAVGLWVAWATLLFELPTQSTALRRLWPRAYRLRNKIEERRWTSQCDYLLTEQAPLGAIIFWGNHAPSVRLSFDLTRATGGFEPCNARLLLCSGANSLPQAPFGRYTHTCTCVLRPGALSISSAAPIWAARSRIERKPR